MAASHLKSLSLSTWLLDEKGAGVNARSGDGRTSLHVAPSLDVLNAFLDRGGDPNLLNCRGVSALMQHTFFGQVRLVKRLLQDPRVRASVDVQMCCDRTALYLACGYWHEGTATSITRLLLQAGADPTIASNIDGTPLAYLRQRYPTYHSSIVLLEQALAAAAKTSVLVSARLTLAANSGAAMTPSCLQGRAARGEPLPRLALAPVASDEEEGRKFRCMMAFLLGIGGGSEGGGMPRDVFRVVLDLLMPAWDPLRKRAVVELPLEGGE